MPESFIPIALTLHVLDRKNRWVFVCACVCVCVCGRGEGVIRSSVALRVKFDTRISKKARNRLTSITKKPLQIA